MSLPTTYKAFRRTAGPEPLTIIPSTEPLPATIKPHEVVAKVRAVSLNFRDVAMLHGRYPIPFDATGIAASDFAGEVVAVGSAVVDFAVGDRVSATFFQEHLTGEEGRSRGDLGGNGPGVLAEYVVFEDKGLVHLPGHLSFEEGSTLACAGVTAWTSLDGLASLSEKSTVLLEGTGGVSMFALLISISLGVKTIITSSSDDKIASIRKLSPLIEGINYKTQADIAAEVMRLTDGRGANYIINNTGVGSIPSNIASLAARGTISMVGFLDTAPASWEPSALAGLMFKRGKLQGIGVGSKQDFEALNRFVEEKKLSLNELIDPRIFDFDETVEAFEYLYGGKHVGKVVIRP